MADRIVNWFNEKGFRFLIGAAILLFLASIFYKGELYLSESRFSKEDIITTINGITVKIVYPSILKVIPPENAGRQLSIGIAGYTLNSNMQVILDFSESTGLIFYDFKGKVTSSIVILDLSKSINSGGIYVRPEPLIHDLASMAQLKVKMTINQGGKMVYFTSRNYNLILINGSNPLVNYWIEPLFEEGLPISFALALIGWALDFRKQQKEEKSKERQGLVQSLREIVKTDPVEAMQRLIEYEQYDKEQNWDKLLKEA